MTPDREIAGYAIAAGFAGDDVVTATAIALAESGGDESSRIGEKYGLWRINMAGKLGIQRAAQFGLKPSMFGTSVAYLALLNAGENAKAAFKVFQEGGFKEWETWTSGRYRVFMERAKAAADNPAAIHLPQQGDVDTKVGAVILDPLAEISNAIKAIAQAIFKAAAWMAKPHNWVRVALVGLGGSLAIGALVMLARPAATATAETVAKVVK